MRRGWWFAESGEGCSRGSRRIPGTSEGSRACGCGQNRGQRWASRRARLRSGSRRRGPIAGRSERFWFLRNPWSSLVLICLLFFVGAFARGFCFDFLQPVAGAGVEIEGIELFQLANAFQRGWTEWGLAVESVEHDALEDVSERHVVVLGKGFENFENSLFDAHAGLHALDQELGMVGHVYQCTMVPHLMQGKLTVRLGLRTIFCPRFTVFVFGLAVADCGYQRYSNSANSIVGGVCQPLQ